MSAQASIVRCPTYDPQAVRQTLDAALAPLGGMGAFVRPGAKVLLKPNLLNGSAPEKAVTTHPAVVRAVIEAVREAGGIPSVGDSPSLGSVEAAAGPAGILALCRELDVPLVTFNRPVTVPASEGCPYRSIVLDQAVLEADAVIDLPKLKSHCQAVLTGAVKNLFGCVTGKRKILWHLRAGDREDGGRFARQLVENVRQVRPVLTVMDAVVAMEGNGPGRGDPRALGLLIASDDPVACDRVAAEVIGWDAEEIPIFRAAAAMKVGEPDLGKIALHLPHGESLAAVGVKDFRHALPVPVSFNPAKLAYGLARRSLRKALVPLIGCLLLACGLADDAPDPFALKLSFAKGTTHALDLHILVKDSLQWDLGCSGVWKTHTQEVDWRLQLNCTVREVTSQSIRLDVKVQDFHGTWKDVRPGNGDKVSEIAVQFPPSSKEKDPWQKALAGFSGTSFRIDIALKGGVQKVTGISAAGQKLFQGLSQDKATQAPAKELSSWFTDEAWRGLLDAAILPVGAEGHPDPDGGWKSNRCFPFPRSLEFQDQALPPVPVAFHAERTAEAGKIEGGFDAGKVDPTLRFPGQPGFHSLGMEQKGKLKAAYDAGGLREALATCRARHRWDDYQMNALANRYDRVTEATLQVRRNGLPPETPAAEDKSKPSPGGKSPEEEPPPEGSALEGGGFLSP